MPHPISRTRQQLIATNLQCSNESSSHGVHGPALGCHDVCLQLSGPTLFCFEELPRGPPKEQPAHLCQVRLQLSEVLLYGCQLAALRCCPPAG